MSIETWFFCLIVLPSQMLAVRAEERREDCSRE